MSPYVLIALGLVAVGVVLRRASRRARRAEDQRRGARTGELEQVTRAVATLEEVIAGLPGPDMAAVLHTIALQAQILTSARYAAVGFGADPSKPFEPWIYLGLAPEVARAIGRHPHPRGTLARVACEGDVVRTRDVQHHPSFRGFPAGHPPMSSFLGVPIQYRGHVVGNLYLADKEGAPEFSERDERMVGMLAERAAVAIETARLYAGEAEHHAWLRNIIDQMPEGVLLLDRDGRTVALNRALRAFVREHAPDMLPFESSKALDVRFPDGTRVPLESLPSVRALRHGEVTRGKELVVCLSTGRLVPILANAAPVRDEQGQISGATLIVQDITAIKDFERMREEWTTVVAHDLRQPVNVITLSVQSIGKAHHDGMPDGERKALERIRAAAERLDRMIDDLLDASLLESKRMTLACRSVDLRAIIHSVTDDLDVAEHDVRVLVAPDPLTCWIDADRIHQVLQNLISNAAKYGQPGSEIRIGAVAHDDLVEVAVTNYGRGIDPEALPNLFSRFLRSREARAGRVPGLGLGLYITRGLVEAHGGRIWVESTRDESTTFHFTVPRSPSAAPHAAAEHPAPP